MNIFLAKKIVLQLKLQQHPSLLIELKKIDGLIVEDVSKRQRGNNLFWGAALKNGEWIGENTLGKLWMQLSAFYRNSPSR